MPHDTGRPEQRRPDGGLRDSASHYGPVTRSIHWLTALLILVAWPLGLIAHDMSADIATAAPQDQARLVATTATLFSVHKTLGVAVFFTSILRVLWAVIQPRPGLLNGDRRAEALLAEVVHWLLYASLILVPLTGWLHHSATTGFAPILWPFGQHLPFVPQSDRLAAIFSGVHWAFAWALAATLVLHIAGALKHHVIDKDATLMRMLRGAPRAGSKKQPGHALPAASAAVVLMAVVGIGIANRPGAEAAPQQAATPALESVASDWQVTERSLGLAVTQFGKRVEGSFADWTAQIAWDDSVTEGLAGHVTVHVSTPTMTLGSVTEQALGENFLDAAAHPMATYEADLFQTPEGPRAEGTFTLVGVSQPLAFPFALEITDGTAHATASVTVNRMDYGIGETMPDEKTVAFPVEIFFDLTATRAE